MQNSLKIALIESDLAWENSNKNLEAFQKIITSLPKGTDIAILPEMFTSGFSMNANHIAESMNGNSMLQLKQLAQKTKIAISGSLAIKENNKFYNRLLFIEPSGKIWQYDKRHCFSLAKEDNTYTPGKEKLILSYKGWTICPLICYDLRFPVWSRNTENYDLLFYVANWPKVRINAWDTLLKARAIENMSYCIGVNRIGVDANNYEYPGHSTAYNAIGNNITGHTTSLESATIITVTLDKSELNSHRKRLGFLKDKDHFSLEV